MANTTVICWNVRGLNATARRDNVRTLTADVRAHIVCLVETKLSTVNHWLIASMLGNNYRDFAYVPAASTRGGILIAARFPEVELKEPTIGCYSCTVKIVPTVGIHGGFQSYTVLRRTAIRAYSWKNWRQSETTDPGHGQ